MEHRFAVGLLVFALAGTAVTVANGNPRATAGSAAGSRTYIYDNTGEARAYAARCCPGRWAVYDLGDQLNGRVRRDKRNRGRLNFYTGRDQRWGYAQRRYEGRWNVYLVGPLVYRGYVEWRYGHRWRVYGWNSVAKIHVRDGYAQGPDGVVGGAALLLLVSWRDPG